LQCVLQLGAFCVAVCVLQCNLQSVL